MIEIHDVTLRDGNHALRHQLSPKDASEYCILSSGSPASTVEVGHGNGLGASSYLVGKAASEDAELLVAARGALKGKKLGVHVIPGFATYKRDIALALELGVDHFRIAAHASEADVCIPHIEKLANIQTSVHGVLMMTHMVEPDELADQSEVLAKAGATAVIVMDSAGSYHPQEVTDRIRLLRSRLEPEIRIGFHAHNNLGFGLANALAAINAGAEIIDASAGGLGAGAGNLHLELLVSELHRRGDLTEHDLESTLGLAEWIQTQYSDQLPRIMASSVRSARAGAFSGYSSHVAAAAAAHQVPVQRIWEEIGARKLVAGQESAIWEIAQDLANL